MLYFYVAIFTLTGFLSIASLHSSYLLLFKSGVIEFILGLFTGNLAFNIINIGCVLGCLFGIFACALNIIILYVTILYLKGEFKESV